MNGWENEIKQNRITEKGKWGEEDEKEGYEAGNTNKKKIKTRSNYVDK